MLTVLLAGFGIAKELEGFLIVGSRLVDECVVTQTHELADIFLRSTAEGKNVEDSDRQRNPS